MHITKKGIITIILCVITVLASYWFYSYSSKKSPVQQEENSESLLIETPWEWQYTINSEGDTIKPKTNPVSITFSKEANTISIKTDCNVYSGIYSTKNSTLTLSSIKKITDSECKNSEEKLFLEEIPLVQEFTVSKNELNLKLLNNKGTIFLTPHEETN